MQYDKPTLTFEAQADLLLSRGLIADRTLLIERLHSVNYYRLSGYLYPFRTDEGKYKPGTTLDQIWNIYRFDRQMRIIVMDAIERVEVSVRTQIAYYFAHQFGPFAYTDKSHFPDMKPEEHEKLISDLSMEVERSKEVFLKHFQSKYGDVHAHLPIWMLAEVMSFGKTLTFIRGVKRSVQDPIAQRYGLPHNVLISWLRTLNAVRNLCAHHARLWNRVLGYSPILPRSRKHPEWNTPFSIDTSHIFIVITLLKYMLRIDAPTSLWSARLISLIDENPEISLRPFGFPAEWREHSLWK